MKWGVAGQARGSNLGSWGLASFKVKKLKVATFMLGSSLAGRKTEFGCCVSLREARDLTALIPKLKCDDDDDDG